MLSRAERIKREKVENRKHLLSLPKVFLFLIVSIVIYLSSLFLWVKALEGTTYSELLESVIQMNIIAVGLFIALGCLNWELITVIIRSLLKIVFMVWVVLMVLFFPMSSMGESVWLIGLPFFFVYLEVLLDINDVLNQVKKDFAIPKMKFVNGDMLKNHSIAISIIFLAVLNVVISYFIGDLLEAITVFG
ncbi:hypothetical protein H9636_05000 [Ureibacillus sp. Re31]|uniref:Uncharacterized protein n=1 Tax=Ureibacillus galli TaxID=2762222 RepID=A0ABR8X9L6_9BACL|nr:hypothetical protein [Ureibacillus galli]MBD8026010.1 hypothetical protein [Ureibacillus galli]